MSRAINTFHLKYRDTHPTLRVRLRNGDQTIHDLTGALAVSLHIRPERTTDVISRDMTIATDPTTGIVTYQWLKTDWSDLVVGLHEMEYEVMAAAGVRGTFPNASYDRLSIIGDLGQQGDIGMPMLSSTVVLYAPGVA